MLNITQKKLVIIVAALSQLSMQLVANMATVIIPEIGMELNLTASLQLWINIIYLCSLVAISIPLSKVISNYGVKKSIMISYIVAILSLLLCGFSVNFYMVLIGRLLQGLCCASLGMSIYIMLVEELDENALGRALGLVGSSGYVGLTLAPSLTGFVTHYFDWRMAFLILIPLFIIQLLLLYSIKTEWTREKIPFDKGGGIIFMLMMVLFTIGLTELGSQYNVLLLFSIILIPIFILYEKKQEFPILNIDLFKDFQLTIGFYAAMVAYFVTSIAITVLTFHLVYPMNMNLNTVGLILLITPITMVFVSLLAGRLSGKIDPRIISGSALLIIFISMLMFTYLKYLPLELIIVACIIQGIGHGFFSSPNNKYVLTVTDEDNINDTSAVLSTSKEFGKILSSGIYTLLFSIMLKDVVLGPPKYDSSLMLTNHHMMVITCILTLSAVVLLFYGLFRYERLETIEGGILAARLKRAHVRREERRRRRREHLERLKERHEMRMELIHEHAEHGKEIIHDRAELRKEQIYDLAEQEKDKIHEHRKERNEKIKEIIKRE